MNQPRNSRFPFTPSQWQELEHQALIFKYMSSGIPIPPDLLFSIRTTSFDSPLSSRLLPHQHQHSFGWNYLQMGLGRKIDAEPGRCRRTDGKKWRCSKEAFPNSKYCERHMHRGNHRFRKPLPQQQQQQPLKPPSTTTSTSSSTLHKNNISPSLSLLPSHSFLYHQPNSTSYSSSLLQQHTASPPVNHRYVYDGLKEEVDEHAFFTEPSGAMRSFSASSMDDSSWHLTPLTMSSSSSSKSSHYSNYLQLQNDDNSLSSINAKQAEAETEENQSCYMLGLGKLKEPQNQKTIHRFFDDNSWLDLEDKTSTTQLSISIPTSDPPPPPHHFPTFNSSRTLRDA